MRKTFWKHARLAAPLSAGLVFAALMLASCAPRNPEWAIHTNPCCGQDLMMKGIDPPEDRCADIVVDQATALRLMRDLGGGVVKRWHVRFIPGGPACIWRVWSGVEEDDYGWVEPADAGDAVEPAGADSTGGGAAED